MCVIHGGKLKRLSAFFGAHHYMISYRFHQCDTERSGGSLSRILSAQRTLLKDDLVNALVFLFESVPGIHNIDYDKLYEDWLLYLNDVTLKRSDTGMVVTNTIADGSKGIRRLKKEDDKKDETRFIYNKQFMHLLNTSRTNVPKTKNI